mgnify:CR=1 FL=1
MWRCGGGAGSGSGSGSGRGGSVSIHGRRRLRHGSGSGSRQLPTTRVGHGARRRDCLYSTCVSNLPRRWRRWGCWECGSGHGWCFSQQIRSQTWVSGPLTKRSASASFRHGQAPRNEWVWRVFNVRGGGGGGGGRSTDQDLCCTAKLPTVAAPCSCACCCCCSRAIFAHISNINNVSLSWESMH